MDDLPPAPSAGAFRVSRARLTDAHIRIIRMTVARDCTPTEFDQFIAVAERAGLDPLRRQISAIVLSKDDPDRRSLVPLVTIDGLRAIAARHGDYRPMEDAPVFDVDPDKANPDKNPLGIIRAEVKVWRCFDGRWHPITGEAWWDEYAPLLEATESGGGDAKVARLVQNWRRMGRALIAKCAEAQALRRGWPEDLSGLYGEEELHRAETEQILAHERADRAGEEARQRALTRSSDFLVAFEAGGPLETIRRADFALRFAAFIATARSAAEIEDFQMRNRDPLAAFWAWSPGDALDLKRQAERAIVRLRDQANAAEPEISPSRTGRRRKQKLSQTTDQMDQTAPA